MMNRRHVLLTGMASLVAAHVAQAGEPHVWLDMNQQELDDAYDQSKYAPNQKDIQDKYAVLSEQVRAQLGMPERHRYGEGQIEELDFYRAKSSGSAPLLIYLHGGAWRAGLAKDYGFPAGLVVPRGVHYVAVDFNNALETKGDVLAMVDQCRRAVAWIWKNADRLGVNRERMYLAGHSSGAHLAGQTLVADWPAFGVPAQPFQAALLESGLYEMKPVRLSARSKYVAFTDDSEAKLSTQRQLARIDIPVVLAYGTKETPEFKRQTRDFASAMLAAGKTVELIVGRGYNHFEFLLTMAEPGGVIGSQVLRMIGV